MKLVTWNTQWCCGLDGVVSPRRIVDGARALGDFDVLCLQEIAQGYGAMPGAPGDQPAELAALLPGFRLFFGAAVDEFAADGTRQRFGNLIATRLPVLQLQHHPLPWPADAGVPSMPRMCTVLTLLDPGLGALRVMTTHLEYYAQSQREAQIDAIRRLHAEAWALSGRARLPEETGGPFEVFPRPAEAILCGDMNFPAAAPERARLLAPISGGAPAFHDAWAVLHPGAPHAPTCGIHPVGFVDRPECFDYVFLTEGLAARLATHGIDAATAASDHQPVWVTLR